MSMLEPRAMSVSPRPADALGECALCQYCGNEDVLSQGIESYIVNSIGRVHRAEICRQVADMINKQNTDITVSVADVHAHIEHHMMCKGVMLERMVADLSEVMHQSQRACFVKSEDDTTVFEPKNVATYLRTVDQMANLLKMEHFRAR